MPLFKPDPYFLGAFTFAQMKALTGMPDGATVFCTSYPANKGSTWRYSSALSDWFPNSPCKVHENTATITGLNQTAVQTLLQMPMAAGLLANKVFRVLITGARNGTTDVPAMALRLGAAGTSADAAINGSISAMGGTNRSIGTESWYRMASATSAERLGSAANTPFTAQGSANLVNAATTVDTVASACYLTITTTMPGTSDAPQLGYVAVEIQP